MATDMKAMMQRGKDLAGRITPLQKIALGAVTLTVVAGVFVLSRTGTAVEMSPLYTGLSTTDASAVVDKLNSQGESYQLTDAGHTILVPKADVYNVRVAMAGAGLPSSNDGYALLDKQGITTSEFTQRVDYQRALEGELQKTLSVMDGVQSASVHLALPDESVFVDTPANPTASVMVVPKGNGGFSDDEVQAIVHLVSSSVKNMKPADVTVIGSNGAVLSAPGMDTASTSGATARTKAERAFELQLSQTLTNQIARITGADKVAVTVNAKLNLDESSTTKENYGPSGTDNAGAVVVGDSCAAEVYGPGVGQSGQTGVLGPDGAVITPSVPSTIGTGGYQKGNCDKTYAVDRSVTQEMNVPGTVKQLKIAVLLDEKSVTEAQAKDIIKPLVETAAGIDESQGDKVVVSLMPFDTSAAKTAADAAKADAAAQDKAKQTDLIRTGVVAFVILIALVLAYRSTKKARKITATPISIGEINAVPRANLQNPELAAVGAGASGDELTAADGTKAVTGGSHGHPNSLALAMDSRTDSPMAEIAEIAQTKPEEVANVLRAWLAESNKRR